jgi:hypothetical protein
MFVAHGCVDRFRSAWPGLEVHGVPQALELLEAHARVGGADVFDADKDRLSPVAVVVVPFEDCPAVGVTEVGLGEVEDDFQGYVEDF